MDLDLAEEQQMVIDMAKAMLEEHCPTQLVRDMEDDPKGLPEDLWKQMSELGLTGLLIPEPYGGGGLGPITVRARTPPPLYPSSSATRTTREAWRRRQRR